MYFVIYRCWKLTTDRFEICLTVEETTCSQQPSKTLLRFSQGTFGYSEPQHCDKAPCYCTQMRARSFPSALFHPSTVNGFPLQGRHDSQHATHILPHPPHCPLYLSSTLFVSHTCSPGLLQSHPTLICTWEPCSQHPRAPIRPFCIICLAYRTP